VLPNRSIPDAAVIPVLTYPDVRAAVAWLEAAFGFSERVKIGDDHRSQMRAGDGAVIVADVRGERQAPRADEVHQSVMLRLDDVAAACLRAQEQGAKVLMEPHEFEYGERQCAVMDPWGHHWTLSQTIADVEPQEWGGEAINGGWG
jgi:uncharacterized glyoxalase superfamily protein PhnB